MRFASVVVALCGDGAAGKTTLAAKIVTGSTRVPETYEATETLTLQDVLANVRYDFHEGHYEEGEIGITVLDPVGQEVARGGGGGEYIPHVGQNPFMPLEDGRSIGGVLLLFDGGHGNGSQALLKPAITTMKAKLRDQGAEAICSMKPDWMPTAGLRQVPVGVVATHADQEYNPDVKWIKEGKITVPMTIGVPFWKISNFEGIEGGVSKKGGCLRGNMKVPHPTTPGKMQTKPVLEPVTPAYWLDPLQYILRAHTGQDDLVITHLMGEPVAMGANP